MRVPFRISFPLLALVSVLPCTEAPAWDTLDGKAPIVIGHRGAPGYLPDHTLEGYTRAIELGADFIEPDLVMTRDGHLIARHEPMLGGTTDIASRPEFAALKTTRNVDGQAVTDWFASDLTLAEIKSLRAVQPIASRDQTYNGQFRIPTFDEVIALAKAQSLSTGRTIGIYPEIKHSTFHQGLGLAMEDKVIDAIHAAYGNSADAPVYIQSFEVGNLKYLNGRTSIQLVQLVDADDVNPDGSLSLVAPYHKPYDFVVAGDARTFADLLTADGLAEIATYADGVGPWKPYLLKTVADGVERTGDGVLTINDRLVVGDTGVIDAAHAAGLKVHTWTFRNDRSQYGFADPQLEMQAYFALGVDGVFTDFADTGVAARAALAPVPEPGTTALMLAGLGLLVAVARRARPAP